MRKIVTMWIYVIYSQKGMDSMEFWSEVLERIRWKIPKASYDMWFARTEAEWNGDVLYILTENQVCKDWLSNRYKKFIALTVEEMTGEKVQLQIVNKDVNERKINYNPKAPYEEIKNFILQQNIMINRLQKRVRELEKKVVYLEAGDRIVR